MAQYKMQQRNSGNKMFKTKMHVLNDKLNFQAKIKSDNKHVFTFTFSNIIVKKPLGHN